MSLGEGIRAPAGWGVLFTFYNPLQQYLFIPRPMSSEFLRGPVQPQYGAKCP